jgi:hypothetical protein
MIIKIIVIFLLALFLYGFARPLGALTYCKIAVGTGGGSVEVSSSQVENAEAAKVDQDQQVQDCTDKTVAKLSIKPLDDLFSKLTSSRVGS